MRSLRAIILDDEQHCVESLALDLEKYCPEVEVVAALTSAKECLKAIKQYRPELLFLDIEMPWMNGFELLDYLYPVDFEVIFVTAYDSYAVQAFRASAVDYLMKPVDKNDLAAAVGKVHQKVNSTNSTDQAHIRQLLDTYFSRNTSHKISIPDKNGQKFIPIYKILYVEASSNYSILHMTGGEQVVVTLTLKSIEEKLPSEGFVRVHHSFIVQLDQVTQFVKSDGGYLIMENGAQVPISRSKRSSVREMIESEFK